MVQYQSIKAVNEAQKRATHHSFIPSVQVHVCVCVCVCPK